jgi:class 3 adenylate cyclase
LREHHEEEAHAGERRIKEQQALFGQFFDPQLADRVLTDPSLLDAKSEQITVMFCDIVAFSQVTERLPVDLSLEWLRSVLSEVSACIVAEGGVLVDFVGDAVMAIWGAPEAQEDHAVRGCRTSRAIIERVKQLSRKWENTIERSTDVILGLNSGTANVGNVGSEQKFKYGALGNTVNLASRIQGVTKRFGIPVAIGQNTRDELDQSIEVSRLSRVRVVNIKEPQELFELVVDDSGAAWPARTIYQSGLAAFESGEFSLATKYLASVVNDFPNYAPAKMLLLRAVDALANGEPDQHPVWVLDEK